MLVLPLGKPDGTPRGITVVMFSNSNERVVIRLAHDIAASFAEQIENGGDCCKQLYGVV